MKTLLKKINWKARAKNKLFWITIIPALLVIVKQVGELFGVQIDIQFVSSKLVELVESIFLVLGLLGIVADPTTKGVSDSTAALSYTEPK